MKVMAVAFLLLPSCVAKAQFDLSSLSNLGDVVTNLTSVFNPDQQASTKSIIRTWDSSEPAILFTSDNFLAQAGAKIASNKIEQNIQKHLNKYGIKKGALKFTFRSDGTYTEVLGKKTLEGTWKIEDSKLMLSHSGVQTTTLTTQIEGNQLMFVTDATKLLTFFKNIGSKSTNSSIKTVTTLMKSVNGMQAGLTLTKQ